MYWYDLAYLCIVLAHTGMNGDEPGKIVSPFLLIAPLQYVPKILFTQAPIDRLTTNITKNALPNETVILNYILVVTQLAVA